MEGATPSGAGGGVVERCLVRIHGRVHGVGFRVATQRCAHELRLTGAVRNDPDGTVCIVAEGDTRALDAFLDWCAEGPRHALVDRVDILRREQADHRTHAAFVILA